MALAPPPPLHIPAAPILPLFCFNTFIRVTIILAPLQPKGCPNATAPPCTFTLAAFNFIFCVFTIYRKATEKQLTKIISKYNSEENKLLINKYCERKGFEKHRNSGNIIIYNKLNYLAINPRFQTSRIFILDKNDIYLTMIKENQKLNIPVLFSQISLKRDIKRLCQ